VEAETQPFKPQATRQADLHGRYADTFAVRFLGTECNVGQTRQMQAQQAELEEFVEQGKDAAVELVLEADVGHDHTNRQLAVEHGHAAEQHQHDVLGTHQETMHQLHVDAEALQAQAIVQLVGQQVLPVAQAVGLAVAQANAGNGAHAFHEVAVLHCGTVDRRLIAGMELSMQGEAQQQVDQHGDQRHPGELRAVDKHQDQGAADHQRIDAGLDNAGAEEVAHVVQGAETRQHVTEMAPLEPVERQAQEVAADIYRELEAEAVADVEHEPRAQEL